MKLLRDIWMLCVLLIGIHCTGEIAHSQCTHKVNQCGVQTPILCGCVGVEHEFTICHAGTDYVANVWICTQYATTTLIDNPCTSLSPNECDYAVNSVSWVKKICVPPALKDLGLPAIYQAIVNGTDLCCNNFLGVTIPQCNSGTTCKTLTNTGIYCHILALPKCLEKNYTTGCYMACDNGVNCGQHCFVERRYCKTSPTHCCRYMRAVWEGSNEPCTGECNTYFDECCTLADKTCCTP